ncbi:MAG TPA: hypothetical protein VFG04_15640 [Planctomycetaceae bacterium]|nr:hypothetical protein [Planctomycetaceae bacterium]
MAGNIRPIYARKCDPGDKRRKESPEQPQINDPPSSDTDEVREDRDPREEVERRTVEEGPR